MSKENDKKADENFEIYNMLIRLEGLAQTMNEIARSMAQETSDENYQRLEQTYAMTATKILEFIVSDKILLHVIRAELVYRINEREQRSKTRFLPGGNP